MGDQVARFFAIEAGFGLVLVHAGALGDAREHGVIGEVGALKEVGTQKRLFHFRLAANMRGAGDQAMRCKGVGLAQHFVEGESNTKRRTNRFKPFVRIRAPAKFLRDVLLARDALPGQVRVELVGMPLHHRRGPIGMFLRIQHQGGFEPALADKTPGANHVGDDIDIQGFSHVLAFSAFQK